MQDRPTLGGAPRPVSHLSKTWPVISFVAGLTASLPANATEVSLAGIIGNRAILVIDGEQPRMLSPGQETRHGIRLLSVAPKRGSASVKVGGSVRTLELGRTPIQVGESVHVDAELSLTADFRGHHFAQGRINGAQIRFIVDTGATSVTIGMSDAQRAGLDLTKATPIGVQTASGPIRAWQARADSVSVGPLVLHGINVTVTENHLPVALLGMSFLSRTRMSHEGSRLILRKRY